MHTYCFACETQGILFSSAKDGCYYCKYSSARYFYRLFSQKMLLKILEWLALFILCILVVGIIIFFFTFFIVLALIIFIFKHLIDICVWTFKKIIKLPYEKLQRWLFFVLLPILLIVMIITVIVLYIATFLCRFIIFLDELIKKYSH